eukprot:2526184-Rhodomonas_salina.1
MSSADLSYAAARHSTYQAPEGGGYGRLLDLCYAMSGTMIRSCPLHRGGLLCIRYAMSGTEIPFAVPRRRRRRGTGPRRPYPKTRQPYPSTNLPGTLGQTDLSNGAMGLRARYAMPGTDIAYGCPRRGAAGSREEEEEEEEEEEKRVGGKKRSGREERGGGEEAGERGEKREEEREVRAEKRKRREREEEEAAGGTGRERRRGRAEAEEEGGDATPKASVQVLPLFTLAVLPFVVEMLSFTVRELLFMVPAVLSVAAVLPFMAVSLATVLFFMFAQHCIIHGRAAVDVVLLSFFAALFLIMVHCRLCAVCDVTAAAHAVLYAAHAPSQAAHTRGGGGQTQADIDGGQTQAGEEDVMQTPEQSGGGAEEGEGGEEEDKGSSTPIGPYTFAMRIWYYAAYGAMHNMPIRCYAICGTDLGRMVPGGVESDSCDVVEGPAGTTSFKCDLPYGSPSVGSGQPVPLASSVISGTAGCGLRDVRYQASVWCYQPAGGAVLSEGMAQVQVDWGSIIANQGSLLQRGAEPERSKGGAGSTRNQMLLTLMPRTVCTEKAVYSRAPGCAARRRRRRRAEEAGKEGGDGGGGGRPFAPKGGALRTPYVMSGTHVTSTAIGLRTPYAMSGTHIASTAIGLRTPYAISGTHMAYAATCLHPMRYPVPT